MKVKRSLLKSVTWLQGLKSSQHSDLQRIKEEACWEGKWGNVSCLLDLMSKNRQWLGSLRMPSAQGQWLILELSGGSREEQACVADPAKSQLSQWARIGKQTLDLETVCLVRCILARCPIYIFNFARIPHYCPTIAIFVSGLWINLSMFPTTPCPYFDQSSAFMMKIMFLLKGN